MGVATPVGHDKETCGGAPKFLALLLLVSFLILLIGCGLWSGKKQPSVYSKRSSKRELGNIGFTIQAGAFRDVNNAVRMMENLKKKGVEATYFKAGDGLFKVRFGSFATRELALDKGNPRRKDSIAAD